MTPRRSLVLALAGLALAHAHPVVAQQSATATTGFIGIDVGYQAISTTFDTTTTYALNVEEAQVAAAYEVDPGLVFGVRGGIRVWKNLALGAGVTGFSKSGDAAVTARLPHPFYLNRNREASATLSGFDRQETMVAVEASWLIRASDRIDVMIFGGPAYFRARQTTAGEARYTESYPYDEVTLTDAQRESRTISATGFTVGADVSVLFSKAIGVGGLVRYARAAGDSEGGGSTMGAVDLGGLQASGGLRIRF